MLNPKVSVIVPVYNVEKYLQECIDSLTGQTYQNIEIILVDDGSKDSSPAMCDANAARDDRIIVIHKENGGLVSSWKRGVEQSTGEYLSFVDSDDYVDTDMIRQMVEFVEPNDDKLIISSDYIIERENGNNTYCYQNLKPGVYDRDRICSEVVPNLMGFEHRLLHYSRCMKLISRNLFRDNIRYVDERLSMGEDMSVIIPTLIDSDRLVVMDHKAFYHYRFLNSSMVHYYDPKGFDSNILLYTGLLRTITDKYADNSEAFTEMKGALDREEIFLLLYTVKNEARGTFDDCLRNLKSIRHHELTGPVIDSALVSVNQLSNKLLYTTLKHPNILTVFILKLAFKLYYR